MPDTQTTGVASNLRGVISSKMQVVADCIRKVSDGLKNEPIYSTFLDFQVNNLHICSTSTDSKQNLLMSFDMDKNGSGNANSFTVRIAYAPMLGDDFDINYIDDALEKSTSAKGQLFSSRYCRLRYGYGSLDGASMISGEYTGLIMDYTCTIQDGMLLYEITGYSGLTYWSESKEAYTFQLDSDGKIKPTEAAKQLVENYLGGTSSSLSDRAYDIQFDSDVLDSDIPIKLAVQVDKNPAEALSDILGKAIHASQESAYMNNTLDDDDIITYEWFLSDQTSQTSEGTETAGTVWVTMNVPGSVTEIKPDANLVFNWMSPKAGDGLGHIVLNFQPSYKGQVRLAKAASLLNPKDENGKLIPSATDVSLATGTYFLNDKGELEQGPLSNSPQPGGTLDEISSNIMREKTSWVHRLQYPYKATLQTMGIPIDIPITGLIKVVPLIYGQPHHSAGVYEVLSSSDRIDSGGQFTTTWNLIKMVKTDDVEASATTQSNTDTDSGTGREEIPSWIDVTT